MVWNAIPDGALEVGLCHPGDTLIGADALTFSSIAHLAPGVYRVKFLRIRVS